MFLGEISETLIEILRLQPRPAWAMRDRLRGKAPLGFVWICNRSPYNCHIVPDFQNVQEFNDFGLFCFGL